MLPSLFQQYCIISSHKANNHDLTVYTKSCFSFPALLWLQPIMAALDFTPPLPSKKKKTNVLHYVNKTVTCMCVHWGFIRRQMKRRAKCNYTRCAWHLTTLHKWSLQLELMKEAICKTIQVQMMVNLQRLSSVIRQTLTCSSLLYNYTSYTLFSGQT